ncbi:hypothetical protein [Helicobacter pylori]|nr:hypothetical protein [Helicobacter pylori]AEN17738.1 hypothetical protein HPPN135_00120 [Helicobacter pylori Puno135]QQX47464.1 hypothetical protein HG569_00140 [Helicobacter pylori]
MLKEQESLHQASDNLMQPKLKDNPTFTSKPLSFWKKWLQNTSLKKI